MKDKFLINEEIRAKRVFVIDVDGTKKGEFLLSDAIGLAEQLNLDLIALTSEAVPVCKITDIGKFLYSQKKKQKQQPVLKLKEIKLTPNTDLNDFNIKISQARQFLGKGHKVKLTIVFVGRQIYHKELGEQKCKDFFSALSDIAKIEVPSQNFGKYINMIIAKK